MPMMGRSRVRTLNPIPILCGCILTTQVQAASLVLSTDKPEVSAQHTSFATEDGGLIYADLYGDGERGVVLAHGGRFTKESWQPQAQSLTRAGFRVLAFDFRGFGKSHGPGDSDMYTAPMQLDVLAAVRYLRKNGAKTVSVIGASFGGSAAADASIASQPGEIDRLILLAAEANGPAERIKSPLLVVVARDDASSDGPRLPRIRAWFDKAPEPKQLIVLDGSAHAQFLFQTEQADRVMKEILRFLTPKEVGAKPNLVYQRQMAKPVDVGSLRCLFACPQSPNVGGAGATETWCHSNPASLVLNGVGVHRTLGQISGRLVNASR
jgi:pimeloyl-ACP methyl ester carboxylesterase